MEARPSRAAWRIQSDPTRVSSISSRPAMCFRPPTWSPPAIRWSFAPNATRGRTAAWPGLLACTCPAATRMRPLDVLGWMAVLGPLAGVVVHGLTRIFTNGRKEG